MKRRILIREIQRKVASRFGRPLAEMRSPDRSVAAARPRQVAMYLSRCLTSASLPSIGTHFGGRDHTTVIHAMRRIEQLRGQDPALCSAIASLEHELVTL